VKSWKGEGGVGEGEAAVPSQDLGEAAVAAGAAEPEAAAVRGQARRGAQRQGVPEEPGVLRVRPRREAAPRAGA